MTVQGVLGWVCERRVCLCGVSSKGDFCRALSERDVRIWRAVTQPVLASSPDSVSVKDIFVWLGLLPTLAQSSSSPSPRCPGSQCCKCY